MTIFITGIRGFLGSNLAQALRTRGHRVTGSSREGTDTACLQLGEAVDPAIFEDADVIVHCAHDFRPGALERNVAGSRLLFDAAGGRRRIFVSSHSARPDAVSEYGISKFRIERLYLDAGETVVRPGLVIGPGGIVARHLRMIRRSRIIPLIDGGRDPVAVLAIADFCAAMIGVIESGGQPAYNLFNAAEPTMRRIVETVLALDARRAVFVSIPYGMACFAVNAAERLHVPLSFNTGSLRAMKLNRTRVHESDLRELLNGETSLEAAIARAAGWPDSSQPG